MRTIIELPAAHLDALDALCQQENISRAEGVRRAVDLYVRQHRAGDAARAFGLWRGRGSDGLAYEQRLRAEWDTPAKPRAKR